MGIDLDDREAAEQRETQNMEHDETQNMEHEEVENILEKTEDNREVKPIPKWKKFFLILPTISRSSYILRAIAGGYVAYLAVQNLVSLKNTQSGQPVMIGILSVILLLCGAHLLFSGAYALIHEEYR